MFKKSKLSTAVHIALAATMAVSISGCLVEGSTSVTGGTMDRVSNPKGTIFGHVQDTRGNPIKGAKVYVAGKTVKTNAGGEYKVTDVPAMATFDSGCGCTVSQPLVVTIVPPEGYLGVNVEVAPTAQVVVNGDNGGGAVNPVTTFIDGYSVEAGIAVTPQLGGDLIVTLRHADTGEVMPNQTLSLDMTGIDNSNADHDNISWVSPNNWEVTTDANGQATFTMLPIDSNFDIYGLGLANDGGVLVDGATSVLASTNTVSTRATTHYQLDVNARPVVTTDTKNPWVTSVSGLIDNANSNVLNDNVDGTAATGSLVLTFSESMDTTKLNSNSVYVYVNGAMATLAADPAFTSANQMTITLTNPLTNGDKVDIYLMQVDVMDLAGNEVAYRDDTGESAAVVGDFQYGSNDTPAVKLTVLAYTEVNTNAQAPADLTHVTATNDIALSGDATYMDGQIQAAMPTVFVDVRAGNSDGANNAQFDNLNHDATASDSRLNAVIGALSGSAVVDGSVAKVTFSATNAANYIFYVAPRAGSTTNVNFSIDADNLADVDDWAVPADLAAVYGAHLHTIRASDISGGAVSLTLSGLEPGDVVVVVPVDDFGYAGTSASLTLVDHVAPTTTVQVGGILAGTDFLNYGDVADLTWYQEGTVGVLNYTVRPDMLDNIEGSATAAVNLYTHAGAQDNNLEGELMDRNTVNTTSGQPYIATGSYDATAFAAYVPAHHYGIGMSEDIVVTGTPTGAPAGLTGWAAQNNVTEEVSNGAVEVDLVRFDVANTLTLANSGHASVIDLSAAVTDLAGNVGEGAKVRIVDAMPPFVTKATYSGTTIVITFNEAVDLANGDIITIGGNNFVVDATFAAAFAAQTDKTVVTINLAYDLDPLTPAAPPTLVGGGTFGSGSGKYADMPTGILGSYAETAYGAAAGQHYVVDFTDVNDARGNDWGNDDAGVAVPTFAGYSSVLAWGVTPPVAGAAANNYNVPGAGLTTNVVFTFTATNPIDTSVAGLAADYTGNLTTAEVGGFGCVVTASNAGSLDTYTGNLSADGLTFTVTAVVNDTAASADTVTLSGCGFTSDYNNATYTQAANVVRTAN